MHPRPSKILLSLSLAAALSFAPTDGRAQANDGTTWGYWIVAGSVMLGTTATLLGLNVDCSASDFDCQREASVLIWGGVGFASAGTLTGLTIVQWGERKRALTLSSARTSSLSFSPYALARGVETGNASPTLLLTLALP
jgi:hypothetical protein